MENRNEIKIGCNFKVMMMTMMMNNKYYMRMYVFVFLFGLDRIRMRWVVLGMDVRDFMRCVRANCEHRFNDSTQNISNSIGMKCISRKTHLAVK